MQLSTQSLLIKGRTMTVPCLKGDRATLVSTGRWLRIASIFDEEWVLDEAIGNPEQLLAILQESPLRADIFTFSQRVPDSTPWFDHAMEWDNSAVVFVSTFKAWWEALPQESRKNVRRGEKRGVVARTSAFDDALVAGIRQIYDETPFRQGRAFWHYGKSIDEVRRANATYLDRSEFVTAHLGDELIGFIKMVYVGRVARIMQILSKNAHADKRTPNILLTKAVEVCAERGMTHFIYGQYFYGNKGHTPITEFKRRNGFVEIRTPRYFVPLTLKGRLALGLNLHRGLKHFLPGRVTNALLDLRAKVHARRAGTAAATGNAADSASSSDGNRQGQPA